MHPATWGGEASLGHRQEQQGKKPVPHCSKMGTADMITTISNKDPEMASRDTEGRLWQLRMDTTRHFFSTRGFHIALQVRNRH
jgi:hypothetical protein